MSGSMLENKQWQNTLIKLREASKGDEQFWKEQSEISEKPQVELLRWGNVYLSVTENEGRLLYLLARSTKAKYMVEFGASYGMSTLYLGAAVKDNGGKMYTTEVHPDKCKATIQTLQQAQIDDVVTLLEGDARETLLELENGIDLLFLDGWKYLYLEVFKAVLPKLRSGALVIADNVDHEPAKNYLEYIQNDPQLFTELIGNMSVSIYQV